MSDEERSKMVDKFWDLHNRWCESTLDPELSDEEFERRKQELPSQVASELRTHFGTFELPPHDLLRCMFTVVNNLYNAEIPETKAEHDLIDTMLFIAQKYAQQNGLTLDIATLCWPQ